MSNLIKYYNFNVTPDDKKLVEFDSKMDNFIPGILSHGEVEVRDLEREEFDEEFPEELFEEEVQEEEEDVDSSEVLARAREQAAMILEDAEREAEELVEQARVTADFQKQKILEESKKKGYQEGLIQANDELGSQRKELEQRREALELKYERLIGELEPEFVRIVIGLIKKLTGVLVEDKKEIILYLMEQSIKNMGKTSKLVIRVSAVDFGEVLASEEKIKDIIYDGCELAIVQDTSLLQNQCVIEADNQIIDCSLDVQMKGLLEDLKMLM